MLPTTVISCVQRHETREETTLQLRAVGLKPEAFLSPCNPAGSPENARVSARALRWALYQGAGVLFCEDDLTVHPDFPLYLEAAIEADRFTYFYVHDTSYEGSELGSLYGLEIYRAITERTPIPPGLYELRRNWGLGNAQCMFLPRAFLESLDLEELEKGSRSVDTFLWMTLHERGITPLVALPHPVQHRGVRVARDNRKPDRFSLSFDLPRR